MKAIDIKFEILNEETGEYEPVDSNILGAECLEIANDIAPEALNRIFLEMWEPPVGSLPN